MKKIAFYRTGPIGDCMVALKGIYATKCLFPKSELIVYTSHYGVNLFSQFSFIDKLIDVAKLENLKAHIDSQNFDLCILTQASYKHCEIFTNINCKNIFTFLSPRSLVRKNFKTIFISRNYSPLSQYDRTLRLVRSIDKDRFDKLQLDFSQIILKAESRHYAFVDRFFKSNNIDSSKKNILINPFVNSTVCNLTKQGYLKLTKALIEKYRDFNFIIPTFEGGEDCTEFRDIGAYVFINNNDLLNLIPLLLKTQILISPSTGTSHIANNLNVKTIWLASKRDTTLWKGYNMDERLFVILKNRTKNMTKKEEYGYIDKILLLFDEEIKSWNLLDSINKCKARGSA